MKKHIASPLIGLLMSVAALLYSGQLFAAATLFSYSGAIQHYTVSETGIYAVTVAGAQGGTQQPLPGCYGGCSWGQGGLGAQMSGTLLLSAGAIIDVAVGGQGGCTGYFCSGGHGGGSGSFFVLDTGSVFVPLVIAGGGAAPTTVLFREAQVRRGPPALERTMVSVRQGTQVTGALAVATGKAARSSIVVN